MEQRTQLQKTLVAVRGEWLGLVGLSLVANLLLLASSIYMLQVFDRVLTSGSVDTLIWLSVIAGVAIAAYGLIEHARRQVMIRTGEWIETSLAPATLRAMIAARLSGAQVSGGLGDVNDLKSFWTGSTASVFLDAPWTPVFLAVIWAMHPALGAVAVGGAIALLALAGLNEVLTRRRLARTNGQKRNLRSEADRFADEAETLDALGMGDALISRWKSLSDQVEADAKASGNISTALQNTSRSLRMALQIGILGVGAFLALNSQLSAGGMIAASIILGRALSPVERAIGAWSGYGSYLLAKARLRALFAKAPEKNDQIDLPKPKGHLNVRELRFGMPGSREPILRSVGFDLGSGEVCVIMGPSGSGKSTLCNLLTGVYRPSFGSVRLDGANMADWASEQRGRHLGFLSQKVGLFSGTIAENIARMGCADDAKVLAAARQAGVHNLILSLDNGYETQVGGQSGHLSGGQLQRIGLARALYDDPALVVLDEPNANLDTEGERALVAAIAGLKARGATVLVVTHQPAILRVADKLMILKNGAINRFGPRDQVLSDLRAGARAAQELQTPVAAKAPSEPTPQALEA